MITTVLANKIHNLHGRLIGQGLPQTGHKTCDDRRRERCAHVADYSATTRDKAGRTAKCHNIGLYAHVLSRTNTAERGVYALLVKCTNGKGVLCVSREGYLFPRSHAAVAC